MILKHAILKDVSALNFLINSAYRGEFSKKGWTTEADLLDGVRTDEEELIEIINDIDSVILKCINDKGDIIGCVYLQKQQENLYLGMLTVSPFFQNKGTGKELLKAAELYAKEKECNYVVMTVISIRHELIEWYVRHGYKETGEKKPFITDTERFSSPRVQLELIVLEKKLNESK